MWPPSGGAVDDVQQNSVRGDLAARLQFVAGLRLLAENNIQTRHAPSAVFLRHGFERPFHVMDIVDVFVEIMIAPAHQNPGAAVRFPERGEFAAALAKLKFWRSFRRERGETFRQFHQSALGEIDRHPFAHAAENLFPAGIRR